MYQEETLWRSAAHLRLYSGRDDPHTRLHFGKGSGQRYADIAASAPAYLQWIVGKCELELHRIVEREVACTGSTHEHSAVCHLLNIGGELLIRGVRDPKPHQR